MKAINQVTLTLPVEPQNEAFSLTINGAKVHGVRDLSVVSNHKDVTAVTVTFIADVNYSRPSKD